MSCELTDDLGRLAGRSRRIWFAKALPPFWWAVLASVVLVSRGAAQTALVSDAWWTFQQDCNGDGVKAGTLEGDFARLNWASDVANCNGTLTVYEKIYYRPCGASAWTPIFTNAPHIIVGCRSIDQQSVDISMGAGGECRDYKIEVYRQGVANPDGLRSSTNDVDLAQHREQGLAEDFCLSDFFATCIALNGRAGSQSDNSFHATKETGEPAHAGNAGGHSLWYCWTATTNRAVTFDTLGSAFDTVLAVYTGNDFATLTAVTNNDDIAGAANRLSRVTFTPTTGTTYRIAVDGFGGARGNVVLNWNQTGAALADLIVWGPAASPVIVTTTFLSSSCEVVEGCAIAGTRKLLRFNMETRNIGSGDLILGSPAANPLFRWASCHSHYHFESFAQYDLLDLEGNPILAGPESVPVTGHKVGFCIEDVKAWSPTANPTRKYNCNNNGMQAGWADVYPSSLPCQYIDITGLPSGNYFLRLTVNPDNLLPESNTDNNSVLVPVTIPPTNCLAPPANDQFTNAVVVTGTPFSQAEFVNCATKQTGEPNHAGNTGGHSIWFTWTPASNHTAVLNTKCSNFNTLLAVYTGNSISALTLVTNNNDIVASVNVLSQVTFPALAGTTYRIAVDGAGGAVGTAVLNVNPPANDDFTTAFLLTGTAGTTNGFTLGASKESYEPAHAYDVGGRSVWFRWVAPSNGLVDFNTAGSTFDTTLAVYTNSPVTNLTLIAANDDDAQSGGLLTSRLWFYALAGRTYRIAVDGFGGDMGDLVLNWNMDSRLNIARLPDGEVKLDLTGVDWQRYVLLGSTNLLEWTTNTPAITLSRGRHSYTNHPSATNGTFERQFYRAILVP